MIFREISEMQTTVRSGSDSTEGTEVDKEANLSHNFFL